MSTLSHKDRRVPTHDALYKSAQCSSTQNYKTDQNDVKCQRQREVSDVNIDVLRSVPHDHYYNSYKPEKDVNRKSVTENTKGPEDFGSEQHVDMDESSETESAQENLEAKNVSIYKSQSVEDLSEHTFTFSTQDNVNNGDGGQIVLTNPGLIHKPRHNTTKTKLKVFETSVEHFQQMNDFVEKSDLLSCHLASEEKIRELTKSNTNEQHLSKEYGNYISLGEPKYQGDSTAQPGNLDAIKGVEETAVVVSKKKNEISIMEAIMDNNEWLSSGSADTKDLLFLSPNQSNTKSGSKIEESSSPILANNRYAINNTESHQEKKIKGSPVDAVIGFENDKDVKKSVSAILPISQMVPVSFRVHYITNSSTQILAVTGNQKELGDWRSFVPLRSSESGFWFGSLSLPVSSRVEWKFVLVDENKIRRWEECANRHLTVTEQENEIYLDKNWGFV